jgi:hypothetical protein
MLIEYEEIKKQISFEIKNICSIMLILFDFRIKYPYSNCSFFLNLKDLENLKELVDLALKSGSKKEIKWNILKTKTKKQIWKEEYSSIDWKDFKENYFQCSRCGTYDNQQCICYAR